MRRQERKHPSEYYIVLWRFFLHLLYNRFAWAYDAAAWLASLGSWYDWGRAAIPYLPKGRVLEMGHGTGHLIAGLGAGYYPVGIDLSPAMGRISKRRLMKEGKIPALVRGRAQQLCFADGEFDAVASIFPSEYILDDQVLDEIYRVLTPSGTLVLVPMAQFAGFGRNPGSGRRRMNDLEGGVRKSALFRRLQPAGFSGEIHWVQVPPGRVMVISLRKSGAIQESRLSLPPILKDGAEPFNDHQTSHYTGRN